MFSSAHSTSLFQAAEKPTAWFLAAGSSTWARPSSGAGLNLRGQLDPILCAGFVQNAPLWRKWEHMEELQDNGALVMLGSTKRPRQTQTRGWGLLTTMVMCLSARNRRCVLQLGLQEDIGIFRKVSWRFSPLHFLSDAFGDRCFRLCLPSFCKP